MTQGQQLALQQMLEIQAADPHAFEVVNQRLPGEADSRLTVEVSLSCDALPTAPDGLPLRSREPFLITVPADFPFALPTVGTPHERFAYWPHVFWKRILCLYQAPSTEWDPADGVFGFIDRLWVWLKHGALNELNPLGQPLHPPFAAVGSQLIIVPKVNAPHFEGEWWGGFAELRQQGCRRFDLVSWHELFTKPVPATATTPVILLSTNLPWEMPEKLSNLIRHFQDAGVSRVVLFAVLRLGVCQTAKGQPLLFIVGTPQRGIAGTTDFRQHLMVWEVEPLLVDALRISLSKYSEYPPLREIGAEGERLALEISEQAGISWCRVMESRPEVTARRDLKAPVCVFRGRRVCLWGCGALGSHIAYLLGKAGVKELVIIDQGVVAPGLLVRQLYDDCEIGQAKAEALREHLFKWCPNLKVEAFTHDILRDLEPSTDWSRGADFVVDCTASHTVQAKLELVLRLGCPRRVPLVSMMVGLRAERGVLVVVPAAYTGGVKDVFRKAKIACCRSTDLRSFADDFYPTAGGFEFFQPEPGCSDATFIGSATDVCVLGASMLNLASSKLAGPVAEGTACFIAQPNVAGADSRERTVLWNSWPEDTVVSSSYEVRLSPTGWKEMAAEIRRSRRTHGSSVETGGILFGKRDDTLRIIWVDAASGPPPDSKHKVTEFVCGVEGVEQMHEHWKQGTRAGVEFVGMWHTHPEDAPIPSEKDWLGMTTILTVGDPPPRKSLLIIVGLRKRNPWLGAAVFQRGAIGDGWQIIEASVVVKELHGMEI
jgi:integrative and conjugative element protein (TIGR02256 family)